MQDDRTDKDDGAGDQDDADHVDQSVREHDAVEEVVAFPLLLLAEVGIVNTGGDGGVGGDKGQGRAQAAFRHFEAEETAAKMTIEDIEADSKHKPSRRHICFASILVEREST